MSDDEVLVHREGYVGVVEFNRPKRQNAFTWKMYDLVSDAMDRHAMAAEFPDDGQADRIFQADDDRAGQAAHAGTSRCS